MSEIRIEERMEEQNEDRESLILKWMLGQIGRARKKKRQLDERLREINEERNAPIGGVGYDPMPRGSGSGDGAASILFKIAGLEERIYAQRQEVEYSIARVMDILEYLPVNSLEREVCELYYIDGKKMSEISDIIPMSRAQCYNRLNAGIDLLLGLPRIREMVAKSAPAYDAWCLQRSQAEDRRKPKK